MGVLGEFVPCHVTVPAWSAMGSHLMVWPLPIALSLGPSHLMASAWDGGRMAV